MNNFQSLIERRLTPVGKSGHDIIYVCPQCNDNSGHLWVNYKTNKFHCFKCDWGARSLVPLVEKLGIDIKFDYESLETSYNTYLDDIISEEGTRSKKRLEDFSKNLKTLTTYFNYHTSPLSAAAREYLRNRGLSDELIDSLFIREGLNRYGESIRIGSNEYDCKDYSGRILVPSLRKDGTISYYVARDYIGDKKNKYLNPPKVLAYSSEDVWNLDNLDSDYVIICEGVFSAIAVMSALRKNVAVATYGKSIADKSNSDNPHIIVTSQGEKLLARGFSTYYVFYDKDARVSAMKTCKYLHERGANVRWINISTDKYGDHADANDLTREELISHILSARIYNNLNLVEDLLE